MQTRHAAARMIVVQEVPEFSWRADGRWMSEPEGRLHFNFDEWARASGQLTPCDCCGSFGRISVRNRLGREFLQLCAVAGSELPAWGAFLGATAARDAFALPSSPSSGGTSPSPSSQSSPPSSAPPLSPDAGNVVPASGSCLGTWASRLPRLPGDVVRVSDNAADLINVLDVIQGVQLPVRWTLRAEEFHHARVFAPQHLATDNGQMLTARGALAETVQLGLPLARALAVGASAGDCPLHVAGPDDSRLLTLAAADGAEEAGLWRTIIKNFFPEAFGN